MARTLWDSKPNHWLVLMGSFVNIPADQFMGSLALAQRGWSAYKFYDALIRAGVLKDLAGNETELLVSFDHARRIAKLLEGGPAGR